MEHNRQPFISHEHRRKVFFVNLSRETTVDSLKAYLAKYQFDDCKFLGNGNGATVDYAVARFSQESEVDQFMAHRPHCIDNVTVEVYRSVPDQGSLNEKKGVTTLIVSGVSPGSLTDIDLREYFESYGEIIAINLQYDRESCSVEFKDYDSVDKAILQMPHTIGKYPVHLSKGPRARLATRRINEDEPQWKAIPKPLDTDSVARTYCIRVTNLPSDTTATILSEKFAYSTLDIVMHVPSSGATSSVECWLKGGKTREEAEAFVQHWDGHTIEDREIKCEVEEEKLELCRHFRFDRCQRGETCFWDHVKCTGENCSGDCPYGHPKWVTASFNSIKPSDTYRVKITGLQGPLTLEILRGTIRCSAVTKCRVDSSFQDTGYVEGLKPYKLARHFLKQWQSNTRDTPSIQYQLELCAHHSLKETQWNSQPRMNQGGEGYRSHQTRLNNGARFGSNPSTFPEPTARKHSDVRQESPQFAEPSPTRLTPAETRYTPIPRRSPAPYRYDTDSSSNRASSASDTREPRGQITERSVSQSANGTDPRQKVPFVEYDKNHQLNDSVELRALDILQGIIGVATLCHTEKSRYGRGTESSITIERPAGCTLEEFFLQVTKNFRLDIFQAVQLAQMVTKIVLQMHDRGVLHQNLSPANIVIDWSIRDTPIDQAQLTLINFAQAYIRDDLDPVELRSNESRWYNAPQSQVESYELSSTVDASNICAILFWLLTKVKPSDVQDVFLHRQNLVRDSLDRMIRLAVQNADSQKKPTIQFQQLRTYLTDTFNMAFGYPEYPPWTVSDLACRLESIRELLASRNSKRNESSDVFQDLLSTHKDPLPAGDDQLDADLDLFQKASRVFQRGKAAYLAQSTDRRHEYSWSDLACKWLDSTQTPCNERRHDDILTYYHRDKSTYASCSVIITCLAVFVKQENSVHLSIGSASNGVMCRVPLGSLQDSNHDLQEKVECFVIELNNLIISISKQRRAALSP